MRRIKRGTTLLACGLAATLTLACEDDSMDPAEGPTAEISMEDGFFAPEVDTVDVGTTVTWTNNDTDPHTSTADDGTTWHSGTIDAEGTFTRTFETAGTFAYHCTFHGDVGTGMHGTVVVR
jgi:plastocyanin